ncbi:hypothetical protein RP726_18395 [Candidatus Methylospira mobilis]|uniref:hypothetical protein n=1 Tax=Candidatus Methylospira mobilis TaxID=1808979 RepID=UPI001D16FBE6|nr:hypothetical protein [Candidatus Methylospira mobilis]WNV04348.1 hypothetical protein RP726_18395 [Candidatus Methylospira mobilis]
MQKFANIDDTPSRFQRRQSQRTPTKIGIVRVFCELFQGFDLFYRQRLAGQVSFLYVALLHSGFLLWMPPAYTRKFHSSNT